jgi:hypothetical protein
MKFVDGDARNQRGTDGQCKDNRQGLHKEIPKKVVTSEKKVYDHKLLNCVFLSVQLTPPVDLRLTK